MRNRQSRDEIGRLSEKELRTLIVLATGPRHGYGILKAIPKGTGGRVRVGPSSLYGILGKFTDAGLIEECSSTVVPGGPGEYDSRRRYFCLTELGRKVAAVKVEQLESLAVQARQAGLVPEDLHEGNGGKSGHLLGLDEEPIHAGAPDASENLDHYVYGSSPRS